MMIRKTILGLCLLLVIASCQNNRKQNNTEGKSAGFSLQYAKGFEVARHDGYTEVNIRNPWDTTRYLHRYILVSKNKPLPTPLPEGALIRTPIDRVVAFSAIHCAMLNELNSGNVIVGVCDPRYINLPLVREGVRSGTIADAGESFAPNIEKLIDIAPEALLTTPIKNMGYGKAEKAGIPIIECADYMESTPLGQAEWLRFYGLLLEKESLADSLYHCTVDAYLAMAQLTDTITQRPTVLSETKIGPVWYMPGGLSYMAHIYNDAGAAHLWRDDNNAGSISLAFESVFEKAQNADFWLFKYNREKDMTLSDLKNDYSLNANFEAFKKQQVFGCNAYESPFYEEIVLHPDYLLQDFIEIFHPGLLPGYQLRYYKKLNP